MKNQFFRVFKCALVFKFLMKMDSGTLVWFEVILALHSLFFCCD
jgi:hypothetical protein